MLTPEPVRDDQMRFAREAPFTFGKWREIKSLYKSLEAKPVSNPAVLATLIARLDATSLVAVRDIPTAALGLSYNTGTPESLAVNGTRMAVIAQGWQSSGLYLYDFDTPDSLKPKTVGKMTRKGRSEWDEVVFAGDRLLCVRVGNKQIKLFDVPQDGKPTERGVLPEKPDQEPSSQAASSGGFSLFAAAEQMVKSAFGVAKPAAETTVRLANIQSITATATHVYAACAASGKNNALPGSLCIVDVSDPDQPQLVGAVLVEDAEKVVLVPGSTLVALLANPRNRGQQTQCSLYLVDVANPQDPKIVVRQMIAPASAMVATDTHLYVGTTSAGSGSNQGIRVIDVTNPRSPRLVGDIPLTGYYGAEHLAYREGFLYASLRYGRIQVIDVRDPSKPVRLRELAPSYIKGLQIAGDRLYSGVGVSVALWSLQIPERPTLIGTPPSAATLGYMKRRARRLLKTLAKSDPVLFTEIAAKVLAESGIKSTLDWATNWVLIDLLFGEGRRINQVSHGRGRMVEMQAVGLRIRRREERGRSAWDAHPGHAADVWTSLNAFWQAREMVLKVLRASTLSIPALSEPILRSCFAAPSPLLIAEAVRQSVALAQSNGSLPAELAADAFTKASPRQRTQLLDAIRLSLGQNEAWARNFTQDVLERLPTLATNSVRPTRRTVAIATAIFEHFAEYSAYVNRNPVLRLIPMLLASGQPLLREQAVIAAQRITSTSAYDWLPQLVSINDPADQETVLAAMEEALRGKTLPRKLEESVRSMLLQNKSATAAWGWRLLQVLAPTPTFLRSLWTALLSDTTLENALETAMASPHALTLLGRSGITNDEMSAYLQERPQLIGLLSAQSFAVLTQTLPASVTLRMIAAAADDVWLRLREGWLRNLREGIGVNALWTSAEDALKADTTGNLERRLIDDGDVAVTIRDADDVAGILAIREPSLAGLLGDYVTRHIDQIAASDALLLTAATHPLPEVRNPGLAALAKQTIRLPMALGLLESEVPASSDAGRRWFNETPEPDLLTRALALCDSPVASVGEIGREFVTEQRENLPLDQLSHALVEHTDPKMQSFVARLLGNEPAPQFDREVLRTRNRSREAKETVKTRQEILAGSDGGAVDTVTLLALARGASTPRDSDWALTQLVRRALAGEIIEGLTIEGAAAAAPGER